MIGLLASIPSPPVNDFHIGPLRVTFYGIFIMTGVVVAWLVIRHRFAERGGDVAVAERIVIRMVILGFLGARLAYVSTHLSRFEDEWWKVIAIWEGGLALYGGSPWGPSSCSSTRGSGGRASPTSSTRSHRRCRSLRRWGGSATTSTRSSSAPRPTSLGSGDRPRVPATCFPR